MNNKFYVLIYAFLLISVFAVIAQADTVVVSKTADTANPQIPCSNCSLREAVATIASSPFTGPSRIIFNISDNDPGCDSLNRSCKITLTSGSDIQIATLSSMLTIDGAAMLGSNPAKFVTIDGGAGFNRIFTILSNTTLKNLTMQGGNGASGFSTGSGSAIYMNRFDGSLILDSVLIQNNDSTALTNGTASVTIFGGANHIIKNSTIANNSGKFCGGIEFAGSAATTLKIFNTTVFNNNAVSQGGGICLSQSGTTTIRNATIADNTASSFGGLEVGGGTVNIVSSIIAHNTNTAGGVGSDIRFFNGTLLTGGGNLIGNNDNSAATFPVGLPNAPVPNGDWVGDAAAPLNPLLAPLGNYGGFTPTRPIYTSSVANFNAAPVVPETQNDQRGVFRGAFGDIGAFELNSPTAYVNPLPSWIINNPYSQIITSNNNGNLYCIITGILPPGLFGIPNCPPALSEKDALLTPEAVVAISGTPTTGGTYDFTVRTSSGANSFTTNYQIQITAPTAANISVGGQVLTSGGYGISRARVSLTNQNGETRSVQTNSFGFYRFNEVPAGQTYIISAFHKRWQFNSQVITVSDEIQNADFTAEPE
jgi:parallel beta-helix repeat protein